MLACVPMSNKPWSIQVYSGSFGGIANPQHYLDRIDATTSKAHRINNAIDMEMCSVASDVSPAPGVFVSGVKRSKLGTEG
jgi:hypothetical protein